MTEDIFQISDLFPVFPMLDDPDFNCKFNSKKEFSTLSRSGDYDARLTYHQEFVRRFFHPSTGYRVLMLLHEVGTGKSRSMLAVMEDYMLDPTYGKPLILVKGDSQQVNIKGEIMLFSQYGKVGLQEKEFASSRGKNIAYSKDINKYYEIENYQSFANKIRDLLSQEKGRELIRQKYSRRVIGLDEVHNLRSVDKKKDAYKYIHEFLHIIEEAKILLLTATPMVDNVYEIASIMNLILPMDEQMQVKDIRKVIESKKDKELNVFNYFEPKFRGRISFVRQPPTMPRRIDMGEHIVVKPGLTTSSRIVTHQMSQHQASVYQETLGNEESLEELEGKLEELEKKDANFAITSRYALNFVFPATKDNSNPTYSDYVEETSTVRFKDKAFAESLKDIETMKIYSAKYANIIQRAKETPTYCRYIYTHFVSEYGSNLLGLCLQTQGFEFYDGSTPITATSSKKKRFAIIATKTSNDQIRNIIRAFNMKENMYGDFLQIVVGSPRSGESISFLNVRAIDISDPGWHEAETRQAIGRGFRANSLRNFPQEERFIEVAFHAAIYKGETEEESLLFTKDIEMYYLSELKAEKIRLVTSVAEYTAVDCKINAHNNQRDLEVSLCYGCEPELDDDYSSYHMYYGEDLFKAIEQDVKQLFLQYNSISMEQIKSLLGQYNEKSIFITLEDMINDYKMIRNRFGLLCYIRRDRNIFYLQQTNSVGKVDSSILNMVYTSTMFVSNPVRMGEFLYPIIVEKVKNFVKETGSMSRFQFVDQLLRLPLDEKVVLLEKSLSDKNFSKRTDEILSTFSNNWFLFEESGCVIHILESRLKMFCFSSPEWHYLSDKEEMEYNNVIQITLKQKEDEIATLHPIYGVHNTLDNVFRIKDTLKLGAKEKKTEDKRTDPRGFSCRDAQKPTLIKYMVHFNLEPPKTEQVPIKTMKKFIKDKLPDLDLDISDKTLSLYYLWYQNSTRFMCDSIEKHLHSIDAVFYK